MKLTDIFPSGAPPKIEARDLKFGDVVFICPNATCFAKSQTGIGVYLGRTANGAEIFVWGVAEWRRFESEQLRGKELRVRTIWARLKASSDENVDDFEAFQYLRLGDSRSFVLPDGYDIEQINPINQ